MPLVFISTGTSTGDTTGSSDWVKELCKKFNENGDGSVFGIIDWDLKNDSEDHVFVCVVHCIYLVGESPIYA